MQIKRHLPLNLTVLALAAVFWQADANAQTNQAEKEGSRARGVSKRSAKRGAAVSKRRHLRVWQSSQMRERARVYEPFIAAAARKYGVDPRVLWTIAYLETRFRTELVSPKNARGLMQFIPGTARRFNLTNPHDGPAAIEAAAKYVQQLTAKFGNRLDLVLASYNSGEAAVDCYLTGRTLRLDGGKVINPRGIKTSGVPPYLETISYVKRGVLVFSRVGSVGVFNPELIAATRALQSPAMNIGVSEQRAVDSELRDLGGVPATVLFSGQQNIGQIGIAQNTRGTGSASQPAGSGVGVRVADAKGADSGAFQTVFFDVHSGVRYLVSKGSIVKPLDAVSGDEVVASSGVSSHVAVQSHAVEKSVYLGAGGER